MSSTLSVGVVGPSHWTYMAAVMNEYIGQLLKKKSPRTKLEELPMGVYKSARKFFDLVIQNTNGKVPENPLASINAYMIATEAMEGQQKPPLESRKELRNRLTSYINFLDDLPKMKSIPRHDVQIAKELQSLFLNLARDGEEEAYQKRVVDSDPKELQLRQRRSASVSA